MTKTLEANYLKIALLSAGRLALMAISGLVGYLIGSIGSEHGLDDSQTFYATIESISGNSILVEGLEENDINFRSQFSFAISSTTMLTWRYEPISVADLDVGDRVSITFSGAVLESYPAQISDVTRVQVLDDEL